MDANRRSGLTPQVVLGLGVIAFGLVLTFDNLGLIDGRYVFRLWPLGLIAVGVSHLLQDHRGMAVVIGGRGPRLLIGIPWILVGSLLLLGNLGVLHVHIWDLWPVVLIVIGASLVWQAADRRRAPVSDSTSTIEAIAVMSGVQRRTSSPEFRGGELTAVMGGVEVDLRQATIADGEAVINVFAFWGGIKLKVPEQWVVIARVAPLMGGYEDKTRSPKHDRSQRLVVRGTAIMGGIEVTN